TNTVFAVSLQTATLPALGLWAGQELALNAFLVHGFITSLFLLALLMSRAKQHERNRLEARSQMSLMEQEVRLLSEKRQEQGRFMAMLIHELKTPLSVIRMVLGGVGIESSLRQAAGRAIRSMTDVIERCRQAEMVEDIDLHPSKLEPIELGDLSLELIEEREISRRVRLEITKPVSITLDQTLVRVILSNLLDNANRYSPIGSPISLRIELKTQQGLDGVTLEVSNLPNPGAVPDADRVFNKYYRHASSQRETGSGLGLFLIRELSERLGGWVRYNPPRDDLLTLSFLVWLPLTITDIKTRQTN
ncbi:MAG: sensor histidine kinase, partial [Burkholderiaceae bacterium]